MSTWNQKGYCLLEVELAVERMVPAMGLLSCLEAQEKLGKVLKIVLFCTVELLKLIRYEAPTSTQGSYLGAKHNIILHNKEDLNRNTGVCLTHQIIQGPFFR